MSRALHRIVLYDASPSDTVVVFGPKRASTPSGASATTVEQFDAVDASAGQRYMLRVENGTRDGGARVSEGTVLLSGAEVVSDAELSAIARGGVLYKPIVLQPRGNAVVATVRGPAGAYLTLSVLAAADPTFTIWGEKSYERTGGTPGTITERFSLPPAGAAPYFLRVTNAPGTQRSAAASVRLNGAEIVSASDISLQSGGVVRAVSPLPGSNVLEVTLRGAPGSRLALRLLATDSDSPTLTLTAPAATLVTNAKEIDVVGSVVDQTRTRIAANGVAAAMHEVANGATTFSATVPLPKEGKNTVTISAIDGADHRTDTVRTVIRDTEAPVVMVTSLADKPITTTDAAVTVSGVIHDATAVHALLNGVRVAIDSASGSYSQGVALAPGINFLTVVATDAAGNAATVVRQVTRGGKSNSIQPGAASLSLSPAGTLIVSPSSMHGWYWMNDLTGAACTDLTRCKMVSGPGTLPMGTGSGELASTTTADAALALDDYDLVRFDHIGGIKYSAYRQTTDAANNASIQLEINVDYDVNDNAMQDFGRVVFEPMKNAPGTITTGTWKTWDARAGKWYGTNASVRVGGAVVSNTCVRATPCTWAQLLQKFPNIGIHDGGGIVLKINDGTAFRGNTDDLELTIDGLTTVFNFELANSATVAPQLVVTSPNDNLVTRNPTARVEGWTAYVQGSTGGTLGVKVNGVSQWIAPSGGFGMDQALTEGSNTITVVSSTSPTTTTTVTRTVIKDTQVPTLTISAPGASGGYSRISAYAVSGTVTDATGVTVTVNGAAATVGAGGSIAQTVTLTSGVNTVTVVATDAAGNTTTVTRSVTLDASSPTLTLTAPADGSITKAAALNVTGTAFDQSGVSVAVNGIPTAVDGTGAFSKGLTLAEGANSISVLATDGAGNTTSAVRAVTLDTHAPTLSVSSPNEGFTTSGATVAVSGSVTDGSAVTVTVNGTAATVSSGSFGATVSLAEGANVMTIVATDAAGNSVTTVRNVTRQSNQTPPPPAGFTEQLPIDPTLGAPASAPSVISTIGSATAFLYTGPSAVQHDVAAGAIAKTRAAVVRGRLITRDSVPFAGATVRVKDHPELGWTTSRGNGQYDLAVAGGANLTLTYTKSGYFPVARTVQTSWNSYSPVEDVVLTAMDTVATHIAFTAPMEVARGSTVQDSSGARRATLLFRQGTQASMVMPNGTTQSLSSLTVRATEYTVGTRGPQAMPANLPAYTGYTYAVEYSADEALAAGATSVQFTKPVAAYSENFLGFPVGALVPSGYYDPAANAWKASANGRVIKVLSTTGGVATVDVQGTGAASGADTLAALGIDSVELGRLATLYQPGTTLWRVPITHFTIYDWNWNVFKALFSPDPTDAPTLRQTSPCPTCERGSEISVEDGILGETFAVQNTPFALHYASDRTPGYASARTLDIPLTGDSIPPQVQKIRLDISVAGRVLSKEYAPAANLRYTYTWDGIDAYGRRLNGPQPITVKVSYYYFGAYGPIGVVMQQRQEFGGTPSPDRAFAAPVVPSRVLVPSSTEFKQVIGAWDARGEGLGGWTLTAHHVYDPVRKILYQGDGSTVRAEATGPVLRNAIGTGTYGYTGDGGPAKTATIGQVGQPVAGPDGSITFVDFGRLRHVDSAGTVTTLAPQFTSIVGLAGGPDGSLYFGVSEEREYRLSPDGTVASVLGGGYASFTDGADVDSVRDFQPGFLRRAVAPDGTLFLVSGDVLWRIANHKLHRFGGQPNCNSEVVEGPITQVTFCNIAAIAIGPDNSIYVADQNRIRRIGTDGYTRLVTNGPNGAWGLRTGRAIDVNIWSPVTLDVAPDGTLLALTDGQALVRQITTDGMLQTLVGNGNNGAIPADGALAVTTPVYALGGAVRARDGSIYMPSHSPVIHRVAPALPGLAYGDVFVPAPDGSALYVFGADGRHKSTRDPITLRDMLTFQYDSVGRLKAVTDAVGLVTAVVPSMNGAPASVTSPHGVRTTIAVDAIGYATALTGPAGYAVAPQHDSLGLLVSLRDARGLPHRFGYDSLGHLTSDADTLGSQTLTTTVTGGTVSVKHTKASGEVATYTMATAANLDVTQTTAVAGVRPDTIFIGRDGTTNTSTAGASSTALLVGDPRLGQPVTYAKTETYQVGTLHGTITRSRVALGATLEGTTATGVLLDSTSVNGRLFTDSTDLGARTTVSRSAQRRLSTSTYDLRGQTLSDQSWSRLARTFSYDSAGQLIRTSEGGRVDSVTWNTLGYPIRTRRADGAVTQFQRDSLGRVLGVTLPTGSIESFTYDAEGHTRSASVLAGRRYTFAYDAHGLLTADSLASAGLELGRYTYDAGRKLRKVSRPGRSPLALNYDSAGRLLSLTSLTIDTHLTYASSSGLLSTLSVGSGTTGQAYSIQYDGRLPSSITASGIVSGQVNYQYTADGWLRSVGIAGRAPITYDYDADGLVTRGGALSLKRDTLTGAIIGDTIGIVATTRTYDDHGSLASIQLRVAGTVTWSQRLSRDSLGRILTLRDSDATTGVVTTGYHYDALDRLDQVTTNGVMAQTFAYDSAGNRTAVTTSAGTVAATYAADDRILTYNGQVIAHDSSGARSQEIRGADTLGYRYDDLGRLTQLSSSNSGTLAFEVDALGRRVREQRNSNTVRQFLYGIGNAPVAELTATGVIRNEFVSVTGDVAPNYLIQGSQTYYLLRDQLGNVRRIFEVSTGALAQALDFDASGVITRNTNTGFQPFGYAGGLADADMRTVHFGARDYDAGTARWVQPDPIGAEGGANRYAYASGDPQNSSDPSGLRTEVIIWHPVGAGGSSFGHVSVTINGTSYSYGTKGMDIDSESRYLSKNGFRDGLGMILNLTEKQEQELEKSLRNYRKNYDGLNSNCTDPVEDGLKKLNFKLGHNVFPASLGASIADLSGLVSSTVNHPKTRPSDGFNAPWTKF